MVRSAGASMPIPVMTPASEPKCTLVSSRRPCTSARAPSMRHSIVCPVTNERSSCLVWRATAASRRKLERCRRHSCMRQRRLVLVEKAFNGFAPEVAAGGAQLVVRPVPPRQPQQALRYRGWKPLADHAGRIAGNDGVGSDVLRDDRAGPDHRACADGAARKDDRAVPDPYVMTDDH